MGMRQKCLKQFCWKITFSISSSFTHFFLHHPTHNHLQISTSAEDNRGHALIGVVLASEREVRDGGYEIELLLGLLEELEQEAGFGYGEKRERRRLGVWVEKEKEKEKEIDGN
jgi:hypothetical protein